MIKSLCALLVSLLVFVSSARASCNAVAFEPRIDHAISSGSPFVSATTDVNGDGRDDVTVFYNNSGGFQTFFANPDGTLTASPLYAGLGISEAGIGDLDGDGLADAAHGDGFAIRLLKRNGNGSFTEKQTLPVSASPVYIDIVDVNEDGLQDVIAVLALTGKVVVLLQTAPWTFTAGPENLAGIWEIHDPAIADLDVDGNLDVAVAAQDGNPRIFYGRGDGTFDPVQTVILPPTTYAGVSLAVSDFNSDGRPDLAAGRINAGAAIAMNAGGRVFVHTSTIAPDAGARSVRAADLNADGHEDLILSTFGGFLTVLVTAGSFGTPVFWQIPELSDEPPANWTDGFHFETGDFRGDGRTDLVGRIGKFGPPHFIATYPNACVPAPALTSIAPASGPATGGTTVTLTGESLLTTSQVLFGTAAATIVSATGTTVTVQTPASTPSIVDVTVTTGGGSATLNAAYAFTAPTTTTLTTEPAMVIVGEPFSMVATIAPAITGGTVSFFEEAALLGTAAVVNGRATLTLTSPTIVPRTISARFNGTPVYLASETSLTFQAFLPVDMTLQIASPLVISGNSYRVIATLDPPANGGTVTFTENGNVLGVATVTNGVAFLDLVATTPGQHTIEAAFSGAGDFAPAAAVIQFAIAAPIPALSGLALFALVSLLGLAAAMKLR